MSDGTEAATASALVESGLILTSELSLPAVLQKITDLACRVADARYGALGVLDRSGSEIVDFITHGVTEAERRTVEEEELGISLPSGITKAKIDRFPTPKGIISKVNDQHRKQMLIRMYAEYEHLSSYVHALPDAIDFKRMFGKYRDRYPTKGIDGAFQKQVVGPSLIISFLSVIQSASELTCLYPCDIELSATVTEAWNLLTKYSLLGKVIWEIRAKTLLGSIQ